MGLEIQRLKQILVTPEDYPATVVEIKGAYAVVAGQRGTHLLPVVSGIAAGDRVMIKNGAIQPPINGSGTTYYV